MRLENSLEKLQEDDLFDLKFQKDEHVLEDEMNEDRDRFRKRIQKFHGN